MILHEWPLSKVELIEQDGKKFILKTIHKDFSSEVKRQQILEKTCKRIRIPRVYKINKQKKTISFLMDYIKPERKIDDKTALKIISIFHKETSNVKSKYFKTYNFNNFYKDFNKVKKYLDNKLNLMSKSELEHFFSAIFNSKYSIVHGDWGKDQILANREFHIVDFGKSFRGPEILDYAHYFLKSKNQPKLAKAKLVVCVITLAWLELCRTKYIKYDYKKEIAEYVKISNYNLKRA